jgi:large subunit ribosomal protein L15
MIKLNTIKAQPGATHNKKRLGRGSGSGHGPTAGKGDKGQLARSGGSVRPGFEGGQMPLYRRIPKRGFTNIWRRSQATVNLSQLNEVQFAGNAVTLDSLLDMGVVKGQFDRLAVLGNGEITQAIHVTANKVSASAREKIEKAGGKVTLIEIKTPKKLAKKVKA